MLSAAECEMWWGPVSGCTLNDPGPLPTHFLSKAQFSVGVGSEPSVGYGRQDKVEKNQRREWGCTGTLMLLAF